MSNSALERSLLDAIDRHAGLTGDAEVGVVIEEVLEETGVGIGRLSSVIQSLHASGEIHQPEATTVARPDTGVADKERVAP